jgi:hypothetical protein
MEHIKNYMVKIESMIASKEEKPTKSSKNKGLLAPSKPLTSEEKPKTEMDVIANMVYSIRQERKGMLNG